MFSAVQGDVSTVHFNRRRQLHLYRLVRERADGFQPGHEPGHTAVGAAAQVQVQQARRIQRGHRRQPRTIEKIIHTKRHPQTGICRATGTRRSNCEPTSGTSAPRSARRTSHLKSKLVGRGAPLHVHKGVLAQKARLPLATVSSILRTGSRLWWDRECCPRW